MGRVAAGDLQERIGLLNPSASVRLPSGGFGPGPASTPRVVRAKVRELSQSETVRLGQTLGTRVVEFTIRYSENVGTSTQATWNGRTLAVRSVVHDTRREFTVLTCVDNGRQ